MPATVSIYHGAFRDENVDKRVFRYAEWGDYAVEVILDKAFKMFNAPPEALEEDEIVIMEQYRKKHLRSLSVGDVVQVEDVKYVCQSFGWKEKDIPEESRLKELRKSMLRDIDKMIECES